MLITVSWDISWYEYVVRLDLLERSVTVEEARRGDEPRELPNSRLQPNGVLRSDRIVLAMQAYGVGGSAGVDGALPSTAYFFRGRLCSCGGVVQAGRPVWARITARSDSSSAVRRNSAAVGSMSLSVIASSWPRRPYSATACVESRRVRAVWPSRSRTNPDRDSGS